VGRICNESSNIVVMEVARVDTTKNLIIYRKVKDLKGKHAGDQIKHNIARRGSHEREWKTVMAWAKEGKTAVFFHNGKASVTGIDDYWYQCFPEGQWWAMSHAEPFLLRTYCGSAPRLAEAVEQILGGKQVVIPAMVDGPKEQFHLRSGKIHRIRASLKLIDYDPKRDFVAAGKGDDPEPKARTGARPAAVAQGKPAAAQVKAKPSAPRDDRRLAVDAAKRRVSVPCRIAPRKLPHLSEVYPIEVIATWPSPEGQKAHETVVTFSGIKPGEVHDALKKIGLKPGKPARGEKARAQGPALRILLELPAAKGQKPGKRVPIEQVLVHRKTKAAAPKLTWHFTGSVRRQIDPESDELAYGADVTGTLIALFPVTDDVVIQSGLTMADEPGLKLETNTAVLPAEGAAVWLIIEPAGK
jgi:hypothetical protein